MQRRAVLGAWLRQSAHVVDNVDEQVGGGGVSRGGEWEEGRVGGVAGKKEGRASQSSPIYLLDPVS